MPNASVIGHAGQPTYTVSWSASVTAPNAEMAAAEALDMIIEGKLAAREFVVTNTAIAGDKPLSHFVNLFPRGRSARMFTDAINAMILSEGYEVELESFGPLRRIGCSGVSLELYFADDPRDETSTDYIFLDYISASLGARGEVLLRGYCPLGKVVERTITAHRRQRVSLDGVIADLT